MTHLIFTSSSRGHYPEYIHHLYGLCCRMACEGDRYVFLVPRSMCEKVTMLHWDKSDTVAFDYFPDKLVEARNLFGYTWKICRLLRSKALKWDAGSLFLLRVADVLPFGPLLLPSNMRVSGILYDIYLFREKNLSSLALMSHRIKHQVFSRFRLFERIFVLNDRRSAEDLNRIYRSTKYVSLPDPFNDLNVFPEGDFRAENAIAGNAVVFLHMGALAERKGTLDILDSIRSLDPDRRRKYCFIFAGRVGEDIHESFYQAYGQLKGEVRMLVYDEFCSYELIASLCQACDCLLIPYKETSQSSGIIGYASRFGKPVIAPDSGLIGSLVREYGLGLTLPEVNTDALVGGYDRIARHEVAIPSPRYVEEHSVRCFCDTIEEVLK